MTDTPRRTGVFASLDTWLDKFEAFVIGTTMLLMAGNTIANVIGRYVFLQSLYFSEELNEILMVLATFVGVAYVTRRGLHIRMSALYDVFPDRLRKITQIIIALTTGAAMFILAWYATEYVLRVKAREQVTPALQIPLWTVYGWVVVGFVVTGIQYLLTAIRNLDLRDPTVYISASQVDRYEDPELAVVMHRYGQDQEPEATADENR